MPSHDPLAPLLAAALEGDDVAVAELVRATQPAVSSLCTMLGSAGEHDDLVQETYLRALRALPGYRSEAPVQVWLLSIARRVCADHVRRRQRQRRLAGRLGNLRFAAEASHAAGVADGTAELLDALDDDRREAFVLTQLLGLGYDEAAVVLDCPVGTIRSRVSRARAQLFELVQAAEAQ